MTAVMRAATAVVSRWLTSTPMIRRSRVKSSSGTSVPGSANESDDLAPDERVGRLDTEAEDDEGGHDGEHAPEQRARWAGGRTPA